MTDLARQKGTSQAATLQHLVAKEPIPPLPDKPPVCPEAVCMTSIDLVDLKEALQDEDLELFLSYWFSAEERKFFARLSLAKRRIEWLGGRLTVKIALQYLTASDGQSLTPQQLPILPASSGRPECRRQLLDRQGAPLFFSISHSGNRASAVAVANFSCGIDIQIVTPALTTIRERFCQPAERKRLQENERIAASNKTEQLALLWCAKEAFRKALQCTPVPAFMEMELLQTPLTAGNVLHLPMRFRRNRFILDFFVTAWLKDNLASALTIIAAPGGPLHG